METFSALLAFCAGNSPVTGEFPAQRPVTRSFGVFWHLCLNQQLSKPWRCRWFETPSRSLWRHCNDTTPNWISMKHESFCQHRTAIYVYFKVVIRCISRITSHIQRMCTDVRGLYVSTTYLTLYIASIKCPILCTAVSVPVYNVCIILYFNVICKMMCMAI